MMHELAHRNDDPNRHLDEVAKRNRNMGMVPSGYQLNSIDIGTVEPYVDPDKLGKKKG